MSQKNTRLFEMSMTLSDSLRKLLRYGGVILESNYSDVPFGEPAAVIRLGSTLRTDHFSVV